MARWLRDQRARALLTVLLVAILSSTILALGPPARLQAAAPRWTPSLAVSPSSAVDGAVVSLTASGFPRKSPITIYLDDVPVLSGTTIGNGSFQGSFQIPVGIGPGSHLVVGISNGESATATVLTNSAPGSRLAAPPAITSFDQESPRHRAAQLTSTVTSSASATSTQAATTVPSTTPTNTPTMPPSLPPTPSWTSTPVSAATPASGSGFSFEDGTTGGWTVAGAPFTGLVNSTAQAYDGIHSLAISAASFARTDYPYLRVAAPSNLLPGATITAAVWAPSSASLTARAQLFVQDQSYTWHTEGYVPLTPGAWTTLTYTVPGNASTPLRMLGVQLLNAAGTAFSGTLYLDAVYWTAVSSGGPVSVTTNTPTSTVTALPRSTATSTPTSPVASTSTPTRAAIETATATAIATSTPTPLPTSTPSVSPTATPTSGPVLASAYLIRSVNDSLFDGSDQLMNDPTTQAILRQHKTPLIRMPFRDSLTDAQNLQALNAIKNAGAAPLVIVHGACVSDPYTPDNHWLSLVAQVFGTGPVYVEYGNEEDLGCNGGAGISATTYQASWNSVVPRLKANYPTYKFIGPVNFQANPTYIATFVNGANPQPDFISWHEYTCSSTDSNSTCLGNISHWATHVVNTNAAVQNAIGHTIPIMITEWNLDPQSDSRYSDQAFIQQWTTAALNELSSLTGSGLYAAFNYTAESHPIFQLIDSLDHLTYQGAVFFL